MPLVGTPLPVGIRLVPVTVLVLVKLPLVLMLPLVIAVPLTLPAVAIVASLVSTIAADALMTWLACCMLHHL
jgi:hypothetical protein